MRISTGGTSSLCASGCEVRRLLDRLNSSTGSTARFLDFLRKLDKTSTLDNRLDNRVVTQPLSVMMYPIGYPTTS